MIPKFRVWDKYTNAMFDVKAINYHLKAIYGLNTEYIEYNQKTFPFKDYPIMQSTGMFDKNGKEIYEGDVVRLDYKIDDNFNIYEVKKFRVGTWMIENQFRSKELYFNTYCIEVVGNKYMMKYEEFLNE